jgi:NAD(P)-dependent dehydrogenase (short-subunit alcohol dehydrogenase family)
MTTHKVAIITGASQGIGAGLVAGYRRRDWAVVASAAAIESSPDPDLLTVAADITGPATAGRIVDAALDRFGRLDTLVNTAAAVVSRPFTDYTAADYATAVEAGITGFFWLTQRAIGEMAARYGGHVVTVSAAVAADSGAPVVLAALTRAGMAAATRSLAVEYAAFGIRANAVFPGAGQVGELVDCVLFLEASAYLTGAILHIDGTPQ